MSIGADFFYLKTALRSVVKACRDLLFSGSILYLKKSILITCLYLDSDWLLLQCGTWSNLPGGFHGEWILYSFLTQLRRPEGPQGRSPIFIETMNNFSLGKRLAVSLVACIRTTTTTMTTTSQLRGTSALGLPRTSLILDIDFMVNRPLWKQSTRWVVSRDHIAASSFKLLEIKCFFQVKYIAHQVQAFWLKRGRKPGYLPVIRAGLSGIKPVNANPGLEVSQSIIFFHCFSLLMFSVVWGFSNS